MIPRDIQSELTHCCREYPVVCITGPRQSGKTTLAKAVFADRPYVSFEEPIVRNLYHEDSRGFLNRHPDGAIFDEVQHVPDLFSYLQTEVDKNRSPGRFILTGSEHFGLTEKISQSLAGRTAILELLPFSLNELESGKWLDDDLNRVLWRGAYPPVHDRNLRPDRWYANYLATYIQRDVRQISQIRNLDIFTRFMRLCAGNCGQIVNSNRIGTDCGVDHKTMRRWLTVLQASYIVGLLPPYYNNFRKRVIKTPKLFFYDTGLAIHLLGIQSPLQLDTHPLRGALFENWVYSEIAKSFFNLGRHPNIYFWRTHGGQEIDFVLEEGGAVHTIEVKSGMTVIPTAIRKLENAAAQWTGQKVIQSIVYAGSDSNRVRACRVIPWRSVCRALGRS
jgi:uncharacterized protein